MMRRSIIPMMIVSVSLGIASPLRAQLPETGDQHGEYWFAPTGEQMPYRVYVPTTWTADAQLPVILMLHGAGASSV